MRCLLLASLVLAARGLAPVGVVGSTGKLGRQAIRTLTQQNVPVRALSRHAAGGAKADADGSPEEVTAWLASLPGVTLVQGDVTDAASVGALLAGCSACLALHGSRRSTKLSDLLPWGPDPTLEPNHSKQTNYNGMANIISAMRATGCRRVVRVTGKGETPWSIFSILINGFGSMAKAWNYEGEMLLRACDDIEYTIVRPGVMGRSEEDGGEASNLALADDGQPLKVSPISHAAIAALCVESLGYAGCARSTLTAMTVERGAGAAAYAPLLEKVRPDRRAFAPSLLAEHKKAVRVGGAALGCVALALAAGVASLLKMLVGVVMGVLA